MKLAVNEIKCEVCPISVPARYHRAAAELWWCCLHSPVSLLPFRVALLCWILHKNPEVEDLLECFAAFSGRFVSDNLCRQASPSADLCHSLFPQVYGRSAEV